jgi:hypothetical protein
MYDDGMTVEDNATRMVESVGCQCDPRIKSADATSRAVRRPRHEGTCSLTIATTSRPRMVSIRSDLADSHTLSLAIAAARKGDMLKSGISDRFDRSELEATTGVENQGWHRTSRLTGWNRVR